MKKFLIIIAVLALAQLQLAPAEAQTDPPGIWKVTGNDAVVYQFLMLSNGDLYQNAGHKSNPFDSPQMTYLGNFWGEAGPPSDNWQYIVVARDVQVNMHYMRFPNDDIYAKSSTGGGYFSDGPPDFLGNFWGSGESMGEVVEYRIVSSTSQMTDCHFVRLANNDVYGKTYFSSIPFSEEIPAYIGNLITGVVSTKKSNITELKELFR